MSDPSPNPAATSERRAHERFAAVRPCKVLRHAGRAYAFARTSDYSASGTQIELVTARPVSVGEKMSIVIAWGDEPIVPARSLLPATVVRTEQLLEGKQRLALRFDEPLAHHA